MDSMWAAIVSDRNCLLSFFLERSVGMVGRGECVAESRGWEVDVSVSEKSRRTR